MQLRSAPKRRFNILVIALFIIFSTMIAILLYSSKGYSAELQDDRIELPVHQVFFPHRGFDDNDHVQLVVSGELPHACYTLGETKIERVGERTLRVHQYAWLKTTGACAGGDVSDEPVPFTAETSVGRLNAANYEVQYMKSDSQAGKERLSISLASSSNIDDYDYAALSDINVAPLSLTDEEVTVSVRGILSLACEQVELSVLPEKENNVFVVLPIVKRKNGIGACPRSEHEFRRKISLGKLKAGQYLVHVRSKSGKALNRIFTVSEQN